jgi:glutamate synthase (NADPH/NADH) small chain
MGKPTGFLEFTRETPSVRNPAERIRDYGEFTSLFDAEGIRRQSARCMDCGVPFCHHGCPLGNVIPEFNDAVYRGDWREAYEILSGTNNFPEFTGRICPAPCESACVLGINQPPVAIEEIEKHIAETAFREGYVQPRIPNLRTGRRVAVIGSGPAGLAAAAQLNQAGHSVTVFERDDRPGGLLRYGIPDFKLSKDILDRRIRVLEEEGIVFRCHANVGVNVNPSDMLREFHAIVLCGGSTVPRDLDVPGRGLKGVHFAMPFLKQQNKRVAGLQPLSDRTLESNVLEEEVTAEGKHVVVIGGGDTGSDCVGTSNRQGALSVTQFELLPKPPAGRTPLMPWPTYPMVLKTSSSHEEGCERRWAVATKEFIGDEQGRLTGIKTVELEWKASEDGRPARFEEKPGSERIVECGLALLAMGFTNPQQEGLLHELDIETDARGNVMAGEKSFQTNIARVFACGDMRRGQSLVVWAISEGRECARKVDEYLCGHSLLETKDGSLLVS